MQGVRDSTRDKTARLDEYLAQYGTKKPPEGGYGADYIVMSDQKSLTSQQLRTKYAPNSSSADSMLKKLPMYFGLGKGMHVSHPMV